MLILSQNLSETETEAELNSVKKQIKELGGKIFSEDIWGIRELSYVIKKNDKGYYAVYYIDFEDNRKVKELEKNLNIQNSVLRFLISKISKYHFIKTFDEYAEESAKEEAEEEKLKAEKEKENEAKSPKRPARKTYSKPVVKEEKETKKVEKTEKVEKAEKKEDADAMAQLSAVDEKLKSLIDDPDISL